MSLRFSVPYNNQFGTLEALAGRFGSGRNRVSEVYFSPPGELFGSGRIAPKTTFGEVKRVVGFCHEHGWGADLVLNSTCGGLDWYRPDYVSAVIKYLKNLHGVHGLDSVTLANPLYVQKIRRELPKIKIAASVLCYIDTPQRAAFYEKFGADIIIPDRDINRDLEKLKSIKEATGAEIRLMANEGCLYRCPYRIFHFNLISHYSKEDKNPTDQFFFNCHQIAKIDPSQALKSNWIRPEDLRKYKRISKEFKITGRTRSADWILKATGAYIQEAYKGNLLDILDSNLDMLRQAYNARIDNKMLDGFFEKVTSCGKNCHRCGYCGELAGKAVTFG